MLREYKEFTGVAGIGLVGDPEAGFAFEEVHKFGFIRMGMGRVGRAGFNPDQADGRTIFAQQFLAAKARHFASLPG